ncbi:alkaline phosphatase [Aetokthonos hydrillicola Thurmond2011]|jgi:alkaline phosphatase|uniref:Alkaline phosphatase n=1 Tax=Aetokthonos hydrillicola Thurmond2011 TaxID=2712845 RepID=A0AAP5IA34_9CYAN|nr:alkaline phosphatase [Aetokthonos hydrillicola]MBO3461067.1 alkaline phosphatase [Aetokthonos hydrillicola CCALA 1050]MBW4586321.1 alkaline phosphatase [Aetokthonos hydrillicola CCALA 1050]MDR9897449.1 alkaline phosphatase [Aetokthonos hydrillicola Thurmond2011]
MSRLRPKHKRLIALVLSVTLLMFGCVPNLLRSPSGGSASLSPHGNGINVILMIGDGMGWEMARAAAVAKGLTMYTNDKGQGLNFQKLSGYTLATTYGTTIKGSDGKFSTNNSALDGTNPATAQSPIRAGFNFNPTFNLDNSGSGSSTSEGNLVGYDVARGGVNPWTPGNDKEYIKQNYPDSANTATALYTGVKTYNNALGVDIYEKRQTTILEKAALKGKSTGLVTSVPISHATPAAATSFVNRRNKYDLASPDLDNILQQSLRLFKPTVLLGGGHPLDLENKTNVGGVYNYTYINQSTYEKLKSKPTSNEYGYTFLERSPNATATLLKTAAKLDPRTDRLLGLYGARGQNGNLPLATANGDYSSTGLSNSSLHSTAEKNNQIPQPDTIRPLSPGETDAQFIAREINENPTLADLTKAALTVLGKDPDGFWLMVEGGDIDWACHDNNMDDLIGTVNSFDKAVETVLDWINKNGGWQKNLLIVTADHDHYLTLNPNFPQLLAEFGAQNLTYSKHKPTQAGHYWGSDSNTKYAWGTHTNHLVPVYYQGGPVSLAKYIGKEVTFVDYPPKGAAKTYSITGVPGVVDQTHIYKVMLETINAPAAPLR